MERPMPPANMDADGYVRINRSASRRIRTHRITVTDSRTPLPTLPMPGRTRILVKNTEPFDGTAREGHPILYIGGRDVTAAKGLCLPAGDELLLFLSNQLPLFGIAAAGESISVAVMETA